MKSCALGQIELDILVAPRLTELNPHMRSSKGGWVIAREICAGDGTPSTKCSKINTMKFKHRSVGARRLWNIVLETTDLKPPSQLVKTKGAPKNSKVTQEDTSTKRSQSYFEHVDAAFPDSPTPKSKCSGSKGAHISKPPRTPPIKKSLIVYIDEMQI